MGAKIVPMFVCGMVGRARGLWEVAFLSLFAGYRFRYPRKFAFSILPGMIFNTRVCVGGIYLATGYRFRYPCLCGCVPLVCWVSFSIPARVREYRSGD